MENMIKLPGVYTQREKLEILLEFTRQTQELPRVGK